jgi:hypothetical protein
VGEDDSNVIFGKKKSLVKWKFVTVRCRDETASSSFFFFPATVQDEVFAHFHALNVKRHRIVWNLLFDLPGRILCETIALMSKKIMSMLLTLLFNCLAFFGLCEFGLSMYGSCFLPRALV